MNRISVLLVLMAIISSASAEEFSWQLSGGIHRSEISETDYEIDATTLEATYFFQPVDDSLGPNAITPFLSRSSRITVTTQRLEEKQVISYRLVGGPRVTSERTEESAVYSILGRHVWRSTGWYVGAGFQAYELDDPESSYFVLDTEKDGYMLFGGKYLKPSTALELIVNSTRQTTDSVPLPCPPFPSLCSPTPFVPESERETEDVGVSVMHVGGGARLRYSVSGQIVASDTMSTFGPAPVVPLPTVPTIGGVAAGVAAANSLSLDTQREYSVAGEMFPTSRLGIRLGYTSFSGFGAADDRYEITATWFFKRKIAAEFLIAQTRQSFGVSGVDENEALIRLSGRL